MNYEKHFSIGNKLFCLFSAKPLAFFQALKKLSVAKIKHFLSFSSSYSNKQLLLLARLEVCVIWSVALNYLRKHNKT